MSNFKTIHDTHHHFGWDNAIEPVLTVAPGAELELETVDSGGGQLTERSTAADVGLLDFSKVNPVTGPIFVEGAQPGDAVEVEILDFDESGWGWTGIIPGFGLLADEFNEPFMNISRYDAKRVEFQPGIHLPTRPFPGTIGLALAEPGTHSVVPPRAQGGNLDVRDLTRGTKLWLPVAVPGALLSIGDTHAAQGDGEVCGTAVETAMTVRVRVNLVKGAGFSNPRYQVTAAAANEPMPKGYYATTGVAPDLLDATKDAIRAMIDHLGKEYGLEPQLAYALCSVAVNLRISEVVDMPNWVVSAVLPRHIFQ
ncbi:MAG TPA: acetamidase/formamidase family protein [Trueperaceae bacterium]|nr:acetamidase/formamidase family protein [Trueperaceae bacterium]